MDETTLTEDLCNMFELYKNLVAEVTQTIDGAFWQMYNDVVTESGPRIDISHDDFAVEIKKFVRSGPRNYETARIAREKAGWKCECCGTKSTFEDRTGKQHFDIHYLVPLSFRQMGYEYDIPENAICLCPICNRKIECAADEVREKMVVDLYYQRKDALAKSQIDVSLAKLLKMYKL